MNLTMKQIKRLMQLMTENRIQMLEMPGLMLKKEAPEIQRSPETKAPEQKPEQKPKLNKTPVEQLIDELQDI